MRVLMTADTVGGVWTYALELAGALAPLGVDITLATMSPRRVATSYLALYDELRVPVEEVA